MKNTFPRDLILILQNFKHLIGIVEENINGIVEHVVYL